MVLHVLAGEAGVHGVEDLDQVLGERARAEDGGLCTPDFCGSHQLHRVRDLLRVLHAANAVAQVLEGRAHLGKRGRAGSGRAFGCRLPHTRRLSAAPAQRGCPRIGETARWSYCGSSADVWRPRRGPRPGGTGSRLSQATKDWVDLDTGANTPLAHACGTGCRLQNSAGTAGQRWNAPQQPRERSYGARSCAAPQSQLPLRAACFRGRC